MNDQRYRIFILGAGFSKAADLPLASELWLKIRRRAAGLQGRAAKFHQDLRNYLDYKRECDGKSINEEDVDFEDFMRYLDIEHFLGLRGADTWSPDGNEGTVVVKTLIGEVLSELTPALENIPAFYLDFCRGLQPGDCVLTFNYDVLLERALEAVAKPYRLFPDRYDSVHTDMAVVDNAVDEVAVLKLHGSIDWFDRSLYAEREEMRRQTGLTAPSDHPVFAYEKELGVTKLLQGPRHADDPLAEMYRVRELKALYEKKLLFLATPWLLAPSSAKILYAGKLRDFWRGMGKAGVLNFGLAIIGYSLPEQDDYAKQVIYSIVTNYQKEYWGKEMSGKRKTPLRIIDCCKDALSIERFKSRYRFVDWTRTQLHVDGFNEEAVSLVLGEV